MTKLRTDYPSLQFADKVLKLIHPYNHSYYTKEEKGEIDILNRCSLTPKELSEITLEYEGEELSAICTSEYHVEVKTFKVMIPFNKWRRSNKDYFFGYTPESSMNINEVRKRFKFPTEDTIKQIHTFYPENEELKSNERLYMLNAATTKNNNYIFIEDDDYFPKWYKLFNDKKSELIIIFMDGILYYDHKSLMDAFRGYCYHYNFPTEEIERERQKEKVWEFKALIDLEAGKFIKTEVPIELIRKPK